MKLVIFDLDQTLVDVIVVHDRATRCLFQDVFGIAARLTEIDFAGKSMTDNLSELARYKKVPEHLLERKAPLLLDAYHKCFAAELPEDARDSLLPGALPLLERVKEEGHLLALYTGGSGEVVRLVLRATGLSEYFAIMEYGTEVKQRSDMIRAAILEARNLTGQEFRGKNVVVIGDSVRDVAAGKECDALTIAVATGFHTEAQLRAAGPDYFFRDLQDTAALIKLIKGGA